MKKSNKMMTGALIISIVLNLVFLCIMGYQKNKVEMYQAEQFLAISRSTYCENPNAVNDAYRILAFYENPSGTGMRYEFYDSSGIISSGFYKEKETGVGELFEEDASKRFAYVFLQGDRLSLVHKDGYLMMYCHNKEYALVFGENIE